MSKINSKIISSSKMSFLIGSGANGNLFPQLNGFEKTIEILTSKVPIENFNANLIEKYISEIENLEVRSEIHNVFKEEIKQFNNQVDFTKKSYDNIKNLFIEIKKIITQSENRTISTKQVNIFSLNYDNIFEQSLDELGVFFNVIKPENVKDKSYLYSLIGQDYKTKKYQPTFLLSKMHGTINEPILPGLAKYDDLLAPRYFELLFNMKSILLETNSLLFVIGYSGNDEHINQILSDSLENGLTLYWMRYNKEDRLPKSLESKVIIIDQEENQSIDTTKVLVKELRELWENK